MLRVARAAGFHPFTATCSQCRKPGPHVFLTVSGGGALCADCAPAGTRAVAPGVIDLIGTLVSDDWRVLARLADDPDRTVASSYARAFAEYHLDRQLRSYDAVPRTTTGTRR